MAMVVDTARPREPSSISWKNGSGGGDRLGQLTARFGIGPPNASRRAFR